ncbi:hypothetical protein LCGC14_1617000 [marine sediment metagenome]|uniref:SMODS and SLOG-associating 2TM effector domain-containing protein n=1 Tax=marine sediment metagenome TaxID=412755 RepID=A0A0F9L6J2_9ZZZZ
MNIEPTGNQRPYSLGFLKIEKGRSERVRIFIRGKMKELKKWGNKIYAKISSLYLGKGSKIFIVFNFLILFLAILESYIFCFGYHLNLFSKDVHFWLYSTIAQSIAALFGIVGMFTAYKLQIQNDKIKDAYKEAKDLIKDMYRLHNISEERYWRNNETISKIEDTISIIQPSTDPNTLEDISHLNEVKKNIKKLENFKLLTTGTFKTIIIFMSSVIVLSLLALIFSPRLSESLLGILFIFSVIILVIVSIFKMVRFLRAVV